MDKSDFVSYTGSLENIKIIAHNTKIWPHRLMVRTPGFHPGNRGSIPLEATTEELAPASSFFACKIGQSLGV